jgi:hypothetical protein
MVTSLLRTAAAVTGLLWMPADGPPAVVLHDAGVVRFATLHEPSSPAAVIAGVRFGTDEVAHTARLIGREVQVVPSAEAGDEYARIETSLNVVSIVVESHGHAGGAPCRLHLRPTDEERRAALDRWRAAVPDAPADARVVEWHPALVKYGAAQLNERFTRATTGRMDAEAWLGWIAVKALGEAMLRTTNDDLCGTLRRQALDGHKGEPLRFDEASGRLRQPLYVATAATVLAEVTVP